MLTWCHKLMAAAAVAGVALAAGVAQADFPDKPVRIVVPYAPGGGTDVITRILAQHLEPVLGQTVVVQNVTGGAGAVGWQQVRESAPDGYTLTTYIDSLPVMEVTGAADFTQDDFEPVAIWGVMPLTVFTRADGPYATLQDYVDAANERPGDIGLAMGFGTPSQFVSKMVEEALGTDLNLVNVGGGAEKMAAVLGGHVDSGIEPIAGVAGAVSAGQFDILAVLSQERLESFPDVPTATEQGFDVTHSNTYAILAPQGTPEDRLEVIAQAIAAVAKNPEFIEANRRVNFEVAFMPREETKEHLETVRERMLDVGARLGF